MAQSGMLLRNMALVGGGQRRVELPAQHRAVFEEGVVLLFQRWTALQLAVHNEWGGSASKDKADQLLRDVLDWFYSSKGARQPRHACAMHPGLAGPPAGGAPPAGSNWRRR